jgi:hypothetical protein
VRRYDDEELSDELSPKVLKWKKSKNILVWAAISSEGAEAFHFIHGKGNSDVYLNILEDILP